MRYKYAVVDVKNKDNEPTFLDVCIDTQSMSLEAIFVEDSEVDITHLLNPVIAKSVEAQAIEAIQKEYA